MKYSRNLLLSFFTDGSSFLTLDRAKWVSTSNLVQVTQQHRQGKNPPVWCALGVIPFYDFFGFTLMLLRFFLTHWHDQLCDKCLRSSEKQKCWCFLNLTNSYIKWEVCSSFHSFHSVSLLLLFGLKQKLAYKYLSLLLGLFFIMSLTHLLAAAELGVKHPTNKT